MAHDIDALVSAILTHVPEDGSSVGNGSLREAVSQHLGSPVAEAAYAAARESLVDQGTLAKGKGRGGSLRRVLDAPASLTLEAAEVPEGANAPRPAQAGMTLGQARKAKAEVKAKKSADGAKVIAYQHDQTRKNNPDVGIVTPDNDPEQPKKNWAYDPHIDPALQFDVGRGEVERLIDAALQASAEDAKQAQEEILAWLDHALAAQDERAIREVIGNLRTRVAAETPSPAKEEMDALKRMSAPYLNWTGKTERTSFEVDTVSLHVHERIDPSTILRAIRKRLKGAAASSQTDMFQAWFEQPLPLREAVDFYKHDRGWMNRLVSGDSLLVMNSLLQKESMAGRVQMIYIDPPYGIKYGSNFQPFVNKRDVKDRKDEDLTQEPEMIKAFRDTWELGIHSYLTYLRDRLLLAHELLHDSGSVFVQISDENLHLVRSLLDEIFGAEQFVSTIAFQTTSGFVETSGLSRMGDYLLWYAKRRPQLKYYSLYDEQEIEPGSQAAKWILLPTGQYRGVAKREAKKPALLPEGAKLYFPDNLQSQGAANSDQSFVHQGMEYAPLASNHWKPSVPDGLRRLACAGRLHVAKNSLRYRRMADDFPLKARGNLWTDTLTGSFTEAKAYVVQTAPKVLERCLLMTTDPGDLGII